VRYGTVLFDLDGTLTDPSPGIVACVRAGLAAVGAPPADGVAPADCIGPPLEDVFREVHGLMGDEVTIAVAAYRRAYEAGGLRQCTVIDGMPECLERVAAQGSVLGVATSKPTPFAIAVLDHVGLRRHFAVVAGASLDGRRRTKADVVTHALAGLGVAPDRADVVLVGDRRHDVEGARAVGIAAMGVMWGFAAPGELPAAGPDALAATPTELANQLSAAVAP
jgi:phosphoglycolate phosphatase